MNRERIDQDALRARLRDMNQSIIDFAETLGLGDDTKKQLEADERQVAAEFEPLMSLLRQAQENAENPEYRAQHKRHCIERYFPTILSNHITALMKIANQQDVLRVDNLLRTIKQSGIQAIWSHIATDFTKEIKKQCGNIFSDEDVRLGAMQVRLNMQQFDEYVQLQKLVLQPQSAREETATFTGFRRGFLNSTSASASRSSNNQQNPSDTQNNRLKK